MKRKTLGLLFVLCLILPCAAMFAACGSPAKISTIEVNYKGKMLTAEQTNTIALTYGEKLSLDDFEVVGKTTKNLPKPLKIADCIVTDEDNILNTNEIPVGEYVITIAYKKVKTVTIVVNVVTHVVNEPTLLGGSYVYDGWEKTANISGFDPETMTISSTDDAEDPIKMTNAGTRTIVISLKDKQNYAWQKSGTTEDVVLKWTITKASLNKPELVGSYTYNGGLQTAKINNYSPSAMNISSSDNAAEPAKMTNAGSRTITISIADKTNYEWTTGGTEDVVFTWTINKKAVQEPSLLNTTYYYNKSEQTVQFTGYDSTVMNLASSTVSAGDPWKMTNAGSTTLSVELLDPINYVWKNKNHSNALSFVWEIKKQRVVRSFISGGVFVYNGTERTISMDANFNSEVMQLVGTTSATNAGEYQFEVRLIDSNNYEFVGEYNGPQKWKINKATPQIPEDNLRPSFSAVYDPTAKLGEGEFVFESNSGYRWKEQQTPTCDITNYTAIYNPDTTNYNDIEVQVFVSIAKAERAFENLPTDSTKAYDGIDYVLTEILGQESTGYVYKITYVTFLGTTITIYETGTENQTLPVDPEEYHISLVVPESTNYNKFEYEYNLTITKATPEAPQNPAKITNFEYFDGITLADIALPEGYKWVNGSTKVDCSTTSAMAYWTPDSTRYNTIEVEISVQIVPKTIKISDVCQQTQTFDYDGTAKSFVFATDQSIMNLVSFSGETTKTDAGENQIVVSLKDKLNYVWDNGSTDDIVCILKVNPVDLSSLTTYDFVGGTYVITGQPIEPQFSNISVVGYNITQENYDIVYSNNIATGIGYATIVFKGNYTGYVQEEFEITIDTSYSNIVAIKVETPLDQTTATKIYNTDTYEQISAKLHARYSSKIFVQYKYCTDWFVYNGEIEWLKQYVDERISTPSVDTTELTRARVKINGITEETYGFSVYQNSFNGSPFVVGEKFAFKSESDVDFSKIILRVNMTDGSTRDFLYSETAKLNCYTVEMATPNMPSPDGTYKSTKCSYTIYLSEDLSQTQTGAFYIVFINENSVPQSYKINVKFAKTNKNTGTISDNLQVGDIVVELSAFYKGSANYQLIKTYYLSNAEDLAAFTFDKTFNGQVAGDYTITLNDDYTNDGNKLTGKLRVLYGSTPTLTMIALEVSGRTYEITKASSIINCPSIQITTHANFKTARFVAYYSDGSCVEISVDNFKLYANGSTTSYTTDIAQLKNIGYGKTTRIVSFNFGSDYAVKICTNQNETGAKIYVNNEVLSTDNTLKANYTMPKEGDLEIKISTIYQNKSVEVVVDGNVVELTNNTFTLTNDGTSTHVVKIYVYDNYDLRIYQITFVR